MKKIIKPVSFIIVLLLSLAAVFSIAPPARAAAFYTDIRVLLSLDSPKTLEFTIIGDYYLKEDPSFELTSDTMSLSVAGSRPVLTSGGSTFTASTITLAKPRLQRNVRLYPAEKRQVRHVYVPWRHDLRRQRRGNRAINTLPVERYLYGVVPYEMSNTFPIEALKAQGGLRAGVCRRQVLGLPAARLRHRGHVRRSGVPRLQQRLYPGFRRGGRDGGAGFDL